MKKLINGQNAFCAVCRHNGAILDNSGQAVCRECGSVFLKTGWGKEFIPEFFTNTFQRNKYTPPVVCRRKRQMPVEVDRRQYASISL